jgi:hypothetical protein
LLCVRSNAGESPQRKRSHPRAESLRRSPQELVPGHGNRTVRAALRARLQQKDGRFTAARSAQFHHAGTAGLGTKGEVYYPGFYRNFVIRLTAAGTIGFYER